LAVSRRESNRTTSAAQAVVRVATCGDTVVSSFITSRMSISAAAGGDAARAANGEG
jgi:hypothetical protein